MAYDPKKALTLDDGTPLGQVAFRDLFSTLDRLIELAESSIRRRDAQPADADKVEALRNIGARLMRNVANLVSGRAFDQARYTADATAFATLAQEFTGNG